MVGGYRFFRLVRRPQSGRGRRYYRLVSYPHDVGEFDSLDSARAWAEVRQFSAILAPEHQWIALNDKARQCIDWHLAGKDGYVYVH